jgi:hypothetical protein
VALDDMMQTEVGVAAAAVAAVASPRARYVLRRGAVYGLAGAMKAGDVAFGVARGAVRGAAEGFSGNGGASSTTRSRRSSSGSGTKRRTRSRSNG